MNYCAKLTELLEFALRDTPHGDRHRVKLATIAAWQADNRKGEKALERAAERIRFLMKFAKYRDFKPTFRQSNQKRRLAMLQGAIGIM